MTSVLAIQKQIDKFSDSVYTTTPARVTSVNKINNNIVSVDVLPEVYRYYQDGSVMTRAEIKDLPVMFPAAGGAILTFPIRVNDPVLLVSTREDIDRWVRSGQKTRPNTRRKFSLQDAVVIPGFYPFTENPGIDPDNLVLKFSGATLTISPSGSITLDAPEELHLVGGSFVRVESLGDLLVQCAGQLTLNADTVGISSDGALSTLSSTISLSAGGEELIQVLVDLADALVQAKCASPGSPLSNVSAFVGIAERIASMKGETYTPPAP